MLLYLRRLAVSFIFDFRLSFFAFLLAAFDIFLSLFALLLSSPVVVATAASSSAFKV